MLKFIKDGVMVSPEEANEMYPNMAFLLGNCKLINRRVIGEVLCVSDEESFNEMFDYYKGLINDSIPDSALYKNIGIFDYIEREGVEVDGEVFYKVR